MRAQKESFFVLLLLLHPCCLPFTLMMGGRARFLTQHGQDGKWISLVGTGEFLNFKSVRNSPDAAGFLRAPRAAAVARRPRDERTAGARRWRMAFGYARAAGPRRRGRRSPLLLCLPCLVSRIRDYAATAGIRMLCNYLFISPGVENYTRSLPIDIGRSVFATIYFNEMPCQES